METSARRSYLAAGAAAMVVVATAGCAGLLGAQADGRRPAGSVTLTEHVAASLLVVVTGPGGADPLASRIIAATARPREDLVLESEGRGRAVVASDSPPPVTMVVRGRPAPPGPGASSYQQARYRAALSGWRRRVAACQRLVAARTAAATAAWVRGLRLPAVAAGSSSSSLSTAAALAANTVSGLVNQAGARFGTRRVVLLTVSSLAGMPPPGELSGDDVIVILSYLPTAAAASAAQANLLATGAVRAEVLGPEATPALLERLVTEGLSQNAVTESLSGRALFANDSSALLPAAAAVLAPLAGPLRRPGALGIVNGYASAPGSARHNQVLSQRRAAAVVAFLEARGVPSSHLFPVGHGAADLVAPGASGDNRRVVVVIEEPGNGGS